MTRKNSSLFGVWLPNDIHGWFIAYLKQNSLGNDTSERFRQFLYNLKDKGLTPFTKTIASTVETKPVCMIDEASYLGILFSDKTKQTICSKCYEKRPDQYTKCQRIIKGRIF